MPRRAAAWAESAALFAALYLGVPWTALRIDAALGWAALPDLLRWIGFPLLVLGAVGVAWCFSLFVSRGHGTPNPLVPPAALVTSGPFGWMRNPITLSHALASLGLALALLSPTMVVIVLALGIPVHVVALHEENVLGDRFGDEYARYRDSVPRWVPRPPRRQS